MYRYKVQVRFKNGQVCWIEIEASSIAQAQTIARSMYQDATIGLVSQA